ncbi:hypothetical protein PISMIDRAFT_25224 [Pisolithus microcarpus 441]|uniref:Uncharacterized protein n=1 Tax=Pisolithus microcarpus 441 TaxID=765257 RepID=A0A0C9YGL2_9AGAM|nr:hypothetical protein PISMIDRAFT_25224 [Pisolithus microcarpus 441]
MAQSFTQSSLSNPRSPARKGADPSVDDLTVQISKLSLTPEAAEQIMDMVRRKTMQSTAPVLSKSSGEDKRVRSNIIGLTPRPKRVPPKAEAATHAVQYVLSPPHSPHDLFGDTSFNEPSPCGPTPPVSPTFSWPSDLGSRHEDMILPEGVGSFPSSNPSPMIPLLATPAPPAQGVPSAPTDPVISRIGRVNIPIGHYVVSYNSMLVVLPSEGIDGPFYFITRGRLVGIIARWENTSPLIIGVSGATFGSVSSVERGWKAVEDAIRVGDARYL